MNHMTFKRKDHSSPVAPRIISQHAPRRPEPSPPRLPANYVPPPQPDAFRVAELVILAKEFVECKKLERPTDTPIYSIHTVFEDGSYLVQRLQTMGVRKVFNEDGLRLVLERGNEGFDGEKKGEKGQFMEKKDWDGKTLVGDDDGR